MAEPESQDRDAEPAVGPARDGRAGPRAALPDQVRTRHLARLGALFASFAHEIRNPLSTIGLNLQLVKEDFGPTAETPRDQRILRRLSVVESEVRRLQSILEQFLGFVRVPGLTLRETDLSVWLDELVEFVRPEAERRGVTLRYFGDRTGVRMRVDPDQLRAVLVNLLRNALDACTEGCEIMVSLHRVPGGAVIRVLDTGSGMAEDVQEKVFTPFFSTKKDGTGLGLATARRIVEQHGGTIHVDSEPGRGTQFTIDLPRDPGLAEAPR